MRNEQIMAELVTFLGKQELKQLGLGENADGLRAAVLEQLQKLQAAQKARAELEKRDLTGTNPVLSTERFRYLQHISEVETYFGTDLVPMLRRLRQDLVETGNGGTLAGELGQIVSEAEMLVKRVSKEAGSRHVQIQTLDVSEAQCTALWDHVDLLRSYVKGYIAVRERYIECAETRSNIEVGKGPTLSEEVQGAEYWEAILRELKKASLTDIVCDSLPDFNELSATFKVAVANAVTGAEKARDAARRGDPTKIKGAAAKAFDNVDSAVTALNDMGTKCREGAEEELRQVHTSMTVIFRDRLPKPKDRSAVRAPQRKAVGETLERQTAAGAPLPKLEERKSK